jgi:hypothetical protein
MKSSKNSVKLNSSFVVDRLTCVDLYSAINAVYAILDEGDYHITPLRKVINIGLSDIMQSSASAKLCEEFRDRLIDIVRNPGVVIADIAFYLGQQHHEWFENMDVELMSQIIEAAEKLDY